MPTFLTGLNWAWLFNPVIGPLPHWLFALGLMCEPDNILSDPDTRHVGADRRQRLVGHPVLRDHAAGRAAVDPARPLRGGRDRRRLAAAGASASITLPFLAPTIAITVLLRTVWIANFADLIVVMTNGGPADRTQIVASYIFTQAFKALDFGYASAIALVLLVLLLAYSMLHPRAAPARCMDRGLSEHAASTLGTVAAPPGDPLLHRSSRSSRCSGC